MSLAWEPVGEAKIGTTEFGGISSLNGDLKM